MSIFVEILVRIASYGLQIDQSHGENRLSHILIIVIPGISLYRGSLYRGSTVLGFTANVHFSSVF